MHYVWNKTLSDIEIPGNGLKQNFLSCHKLWKSGYVRDHGKLCSGSHKFPGTYLNIMLFELLTHRIINNNIIG